MAQNRPTIYLILFVLTSLTSISSFAQTFNSIFDFDLSDGANPYYVSLVQGRDGASYGTTANGGIANKGTVFKLATDGALTTLYNFCSLANCTDGSYPFSGLVLGTDGYFYGTTSGGGDYGHGTVFKISVIGTLTTIHDFNGADGAGPYAGLIEAANGSFYGTTYLGGTVFKITSSGTFTNLHYFNGTDGSGPWESMIQATNGNLYGTAIGGGADGWGVIFKVTSRGQFSTLHSFAVDEGHYPYGGLLEAGDGSLYGTTSAGGDSNNGTLFRITLAGSLTTLYSFPKGAPRGALVEGSDERLYGATVGGGDGFGTIFSAAQFGLRNLHVFENSDGAFPTGLLQATTGTFYGTIGEGGKYGYGGIYSLDMGLGPFVAFVRGAGRVGQSGGILGQGFTGTTSVSLNGVPATFTVVSNKYIRATVPPGATTGYVTVATPSGTLTSNKKFIVLP